MSETTAEVKEEAKTSPTQTVTLHCGDNITALKTLPDNSVDAVVTDPPYGLSQHTTEDVTAALTAWTKGDEYLAKKKGFMGKTWDSFVPGPELWKEVLRVLKPGGHVLCFAGSRTDDLMGIALRLAGFEVRDKVMWIYGSGFPKSQNVSKALDKVAGAEREVIGSKLGQPGYSLKSNDTETHDRKAYGKFTDAEAECAITAPATDAAKKWDGWGTALKPAFEPIIVARKPLIGTVASNVLKHGTGAVNIDGCRVPVDPVADASQLRTMSRGQRTEDTNGQTWGMSKIGGDQPQVIRSEGRFPANIIHDGSDEVVDAFPSAPGQLAKARTDGEAEGNNVYGSLKHITANPEPRNDTGSAARFFYAAKASKTDRAGSKHPTVKPISLMRYLCRLVTPPGGIILDPFAGSGTTGAAAVEEGFNVVLMEREAEYQQDITKRFGVIHEKRNNVKFVSVTPT